MTDKETDIKITRKEFKEQLSILAEKLEDKQCFFILIYDEYKNNIEYNGIGCEGCATDIILQMIMSGAFTHNASNLTNGIKH